MNNLLVSIVFGLNTCVLSASEVKDNFFTFVSVEVLLKKPVEFSKYELSCKTWNRIMMDNSKCDSQDHPYLIEHVDEVYQFLYLLNESDKQYVYRLPSRSEFETVWKHGLQKLNKENICEYSNVLDKSHFDMLKPDLSKKYINVYNNVRFNCDDSFSMIAPINAFPKDELGLFGIIGNVGELVRDENYQEFYSANDVSDSTIENVLKYTSAGGNYESHSQQFFGPKSRFPRNAGFIKSGMSVSFYTGLRIVREKRLKED